MIPEPPLQGRWADTSKKADPAGNKIGITNEKRKEESMNTDKKDGLSRKDLQSEYLKQYNDMINRTNRNSFRYVSLMSLFVFLGIMVISACTGHFGIRFILYSSGAVFTLIMHLLFQLDVKKDSRHVMGLYYLYWLGLFAVTSISGSFLLRERNAASICIILLAFSAIVLDSTQRMTLFMLVVAVQFCITSFIMKDFSIALDDFFNVVISFITGFFLCNYLVRMKLNSIKKNGKLLWRHEMDPLTEIYSRKTADENIPKRLAGNKKNAAAILVGIDRYEEMRKEYGTVICDRLLVDVAHSLAKIFYDYEYICRYGKSVFLVFIPDLENSHFVVNQMDEVTEAMECTIIKKGKEYRFSVSAGAAMTGKKIHTYEDLCKYAEYAMLSAEQKGGGCGVLWKEENNMA